MYNVYMYMKVLYTQVHIYMLLGTCYCLSLSMQWYGGQAAPPRLATAPLSWPRSPYATCSAMRGSTSLSTPPSTPPCSSSPLLTSLSFASQKAGWPKRMTPSVSARARLCVHLCTCVCACVCVCVCTCIRSDCHNLEGEYLNRHLHASVQPFLGYVSTLSICLSVYLSVYMYVSIYLLCSHQAVTRFEEN